LPILIHFTVLAALCLMTSWTVFNALMEQLADVSLFAQTFSVVNVLAIFETDVNVYTQALVHVKVSTYVETFVKTSTVTDIGTTTWIVAVYVDNLYTHVTWDILKCLFSVVVASSFILVLKLVNVSKLNGSVHT